MFKYEPRMLIPINFQSEEVKSEYNVQSEWFRLLPLFSFSFQSPSHEGSFTLYSCSWIILILHLLIIWVPTWVLVPLDIPFSLIWVVVANAALFRGLLHINAARKVAAVHLMWWWQPSLRYFQIFFLLMCPRSTSMSFEASRKVTLIVGLYILNHIH